MEMEQERVLITGITGFLGSHVGKCLLEQCSDKFKIRASVRSMKKAQVFKKTYGTLYDRIEFV